MPPQAPLTSPTNPPKDSLQGEKVWILIILGFILVAINLCFLYRMYFEKLVVEDQNLITQVGDWKTYRNEEYGYEIIYPNLKENINNEPRKLNSDDYDQENPLFIVESRQTLTHNNELGDGNFYSYYINIYNNKESLPVSKWIEKYKDYLFYPDTKFENTLINGVDAIRTTSEQGLRGGVFISNKDYVFHIDWPGWGTADTEEISAFLRFSNSFKFTK